MLMPHGVIADTEFGHDRSETAQIWLVNSRHPLILDVVVADPAGTDVDLYGAVIFRPILVECPGCCHVRRRHQSDHLW